MKTRSVGADSGRPNRHGSKAMLGLMLCAALLAAGCGQKRPLELPNGANGKRAGTGAVTTPPVMATPASAPASAEMP